MTSEYNNRDLSPLSPPPDELSQKYQFKRQGIQIQTKFILDKLYNQVRISSLCRTNTITDNEQFICQVVQGSKTSLESTQNVQTSIIGCQLKTMAKTNYEKYLNSGFEEELLKIESSLRSPIQQTINVKQVINNLNQNGEAFQDFNLHDRNSISLDTNSIKSRHKGILKMKSKQGSSSASSIPRGSENRVRFSLNISGRSILKMENELRFRK